jgi:hypothetical protein
VFVLGKNNTLEYRPVKLGPMAEGLRVVRDGVREGDSIVVNGLQRVRPGAPVSPKKVPMLVAATTSQEEAPNPPRGGKSREPKAQK